MGWDTLLPHIFLVFPWMCLFNIPSLRWLGSGSWHQGYLVLHDSPLVILILVCNSNSLALNLMRVSSTTYLVYRGFNFIVTHTHHLSFQWNVRPLRNYHIQAYHLSIQHKNLTPCRFVANSSQVISSRLNQGLQRQFRGQINTRPQVGFKRFQPESGEFYRENG